MSLSFGRPALPCVLGGLGAIVGFFVAETGIGSMPFGVFVEEAIAGRRRLAGRRYEMTGDRNLVDEPVWAVDEPVWAADATRRCQLTTRERVNTRRGAKDF
jgi:hypothetical protein